MWQRLKSPISYARSFHIVNSRPKLRSVLTSAYTKRPRWWSLLYHYIRRRCTLTTITRSLRSCKLPLSNVQLQPGHEGQYDVGWIHASDRLAVDKTPLSTCLAARTTLLHQRGPRSLLFNAEELYVILCSAVEIWGAAALWVVATFINCTLAIVTFPAAMSCPRNISSKLR